MRNILTPLIAGLALTVATQAYAAQASGTIQSIDNSAHTITLDNGKVYAFEPKMNLSSYKVGEKVRVTYEETGGKNMATAVAGQM